MNTPPQSQLRSQTSQRGFALIATISIMILLVMIALAMLTLSTIELRSSQNGRAMAEAQANARLALMLAIGELQKEMGPDMRISAEAAIHDSQPETEATEGISQPHWLATYDAWGGWLNGKYTPHGKESASVSKINDTYVPKRAPMFRRWLVSLPEAFRSDIDAAQSALSSSESVVLVGQGSLGKDYALANPTEVTRAALIEVGETGRHAWWIGPENHRAKVTLAKQTRNMPALNWENSAGNTAETGISSLSGLSSVDNHPDQATRLISQPSLELVDDIAKVDVRNKFFDLTAHSQGLLTSVRTGQL
ncbi:MAG: hypothetical protein KJO79_02770, partial [Verrucomicrobiae bacterium]|nr:hypothetical protein [Verrucomicrobiae bacterium]NNJ86078.1 hypothetical protein [Akkermansiaceae bacterium]